MGELLLPFKTATSGVAFYSKGDGFRQKVRQALDLWAKKWPGEARAYIRACKHRKETRHDKGRSRSGDIHEYAITPWRVEWLLRQTPEFTMRWFGSPCGTGDYYWDNNQELEKVFTQECSIGVIAERQGVPDGRGWR